MTTSKAISLAKHEMATLAVYPPGGEAKRVDTENMAVKASELGHIASTDD